MRDSNQRWRERVPYADFRHSRMYFGWRFRIAVTLAIGSIVISMVAESDAPSGRALLAGVGLVGVVIGILLQPSPKPEDHTPRARQSLQTLSTSIRYLEDLKTVASQLDEQENNQRTKIGLATMIVDLARTQQNLIYSMAEWDEIAPGAVGDFQSAQRRGQEILRELSEEEGDTNE